MNRIEYNYYIATVSKSLNHLWYQLTLGFMIKKLLKLFYRIAYKNNATSNLANKIYKIIKK